MRFYPRLTLAVLGLLVASSPGFTGDLGTSCPVDHSRLLVYWTADGQEHPVQTAADWAIRRRQIIIGMQQAMGRLPERAHLPPLDVKVVERVERDSFIRLGITYVGADNCADPRPFVFAEGSAGRARGCDAGPAPDLAARKEGSFR